MARKKAILITAIVTVVVAIGLILLLVFGVFGINLAVQSGAQSRVCGVKFGVSATGETVRLMGISERQLSPGDNVRATPLCKVEIVGIDSVDDSSSQDGSGALVHLRWRVAMGDN